MREIPTDEVKRRSTELAELVRRIGAERNRKFEGKRMEVLVTERGKTLKGRAENYKQVCIFGKGKLGDRIRVRIIDSNFGSLFGKRE